MHFKKTNLFGRFVKEGWFTIDHTTHGGYNFCDFLKASAWGLFWTPVAFYVIGWFLVFGIPPWLLYFFSYFPIPWGTDFSWGWNIHLASTIFGGGIILCFLLWGIWYCDEKLKAWTYARRSRKENLPPRKPSWLSEVHKAFKEKYCPLVTFEE